jgi:hypothetical protein
MYVQFQQRQIRIAIIRLVFALVEDVFREDFGGFWIVSIEAVKDVFNVLWSIYGSIKDDAHVVGV